MTFGLHEYVVDYSVVLLTYREKCARSSSLGYSRQIVLSYGCKEGFLFPILKRRLTVGKRLKLDAG